MAQNYSTSPRYGFRYPSDTPTPNIISDFAPLMATMAGDLDSKLTGYKSGTHAARLAATALDGLLWRETDAPFLLYLGNGTAWLPVSVPGPWATATNATNITGTLQGRLQGDTVELRGGALNGTGGTLTTNAVVTTLPSSMVPWSAPLKFPAIVPTVGTIEVWVTGSPPKIEIGQTGGWPNSTQLSIEGISYPIT